MVGLALNACTPIYAPSAFNVAMLRGPNDVHVEGQVGLQGQQLDAAWAVTDILAVHAGGQHISSSTTNASTNSSTTDALTLWEGSAGVGAYWVIPAVLKEPRGSGMRASATLDVGGGHESGHSTGFNSSGGSTTFAANGPFWKGDLQGDLGYDWDYGMIALAGRITYLHEIYGAGSTNLPTPIGNFVIAEPGVVAGVGPRYLRFKVQFGLSLPIWLDSPVGYWNPVILSAGLGGNW